MSDTIKKWHEMQEEQQTCNYSGLRSTSSYTAKYIFLLDFTDGKVYRYDISSLCNEETNGILTQSLVNHFYTVRVTK